MYEYGEHGSADFATARNYFEKAATTGNPSAQVWLVELIACA
jgi:TPR repeat protein